MNQSGSVGLRDVVLSISLGALLMSAPLRADDLPAELPPPPPSEVTDGGLPSLDDSSASAGAELPPPPVPGVVESPTLSAEAPPADSSEVATPPGEELPALPLDGDGTDQAQTSELSVDPSLADAPAEPAAPPAMSASPSEFSSSSELKDISMNDRIKSKDLILWLTLGPSYGTLTTKGSYTLSSVAGATDAVGGLGYNAGLGFMLDDFFQMQFDFTGTPKTKSSTVDNAMFGFGPRLGFLTLMGVFGVQQGPEPTTGSLDKIFAIGARAGLDLVLKHAKDSRVSVGLAPEVYYITPQGADGYNSMGISVSLRIYGYDTAF